MRVVAALGGNALLRRRERADAETQRRNVEAAVGGLVPLAGDHQLIITHGNGPQVGLLALETPPDGTPPYPLDVLGAETEGMIGYLLEQEIVSRVPGHAVATLLTQVEVDPTDPAFASPSKPIGPMYAPAEAQRHADQLGWAIGRDGSGYRRLVPSPEPRRIVELEVIRLLADAGVTLICAGGGGIPVRRDGDRLIGVEAVVDKDLSSSLLATAVGANVLLLLTDVDAVYAGWDTPRRRRVRSVTPDALRAMGLARGSMGPKAEAACRFAESTGRPAYIGSLLAIPDILAGRSGTRVTLDDA